MGSSRTAWQVRGRRGPAGGVRTGVYLWGTGGAGAGVACCILAGGRLHGALCVVLPAGASRGHQELRVSGRGWAPWTLCLLMAELPPGVEQSCTVHCGSRIACRSVFAFVQRSTSGPRVRNATPVHQQPVRKQRSDVRVSPLKDVLLAAVQPRPTRQAAGSCRWPPALRRATCRQTCPPSRRQRGSAAGRQGRRRRV